MRWLIALLWILGGCAPPAPSSGVPTPVFPNAAVTPERSFETTRLAIEILQERLKAEPLPLEQAQVSIRSLSGDRPYEKHVDAATAEMLLTDVPLGAYLEISASKSGFASRKTVFVPVRESPGLVNRVQLLLSNSPEVITVSPADRVSDQLPNGPLVLTFSEPVDPVSVEKSLTVTLAKSANLSVGQTILADHLVLGGEQLGVAWNSDKTQLSVTPQVPLPTDRDHMRRPTYRIGFSTPFKDPYGNLSGAQPFRLGETSQAMTEFSVRTDSVSPAPFQLQAQPGAASDQLVLGFSEPMQLSLAEGLFVPLPASTASLLHLEHYRLSFALKTPLRAGDVRAAEAVVAGATAVAVDDGEGNGSLLSSYVETGDVLRFSGGGEGTVATVTGTRVTFAPPGLSLAVANDETVWVARVEDAPFSRSALFSRAQVRMGKSASEVVLDLGVPRLLVAGARVKVVVSDRLMDPAGNPVDPAKREIEAVVPE